MAAEKQSAVQGAQDTLLLVEVWDGSSWRHLKVEEALAGEWKQFNNKLYQAKSGEVEILDPHASTDPSGTPQGWVRT